MSITIIERLREKFTDTDKSKSMPDIMNRYMGGEYRDNQPFVTGYHQVVFSLPERIFDNPDTAQKWLTSTCESFTPHSVTPNFVDLMGVGQIGASFYTSKTIGREFTIGFREYQKMPIMNILDLWNSVFDEYTGASPLKGDEYHPQSYKGSCVVYQLKPTGAHSEELTEDDIEEIYYYHGVWPKTNPRDTIGASDQTTNDFVQLSVTFSFDGAPLTTKDDSGLISSALNTLNGLGKYMDSYNTLLKNASKS